MPTPFKPRWRLPGPSVPYLVVCWHDEAARDMRRRVPARTALQQLDNWVVSHSGILRQMDEALRNNQSGGASPQLESLVFSGLLKSRISAAIQAGRLVLLESEQPAASQARAPGPKRKVTYKFDFTSQKNLTLPYCVAINGVVVRHADTPGTIEGDESFTLEVEADSTVSLYLNSDAHPSHRKSPVYGVTPKDRDITVTVTEKKGKHKDTDVPVFKKKDPKNKGVDCYTASLTGDLWMKVSYKYTEEDAKGYLPADLDSGIRDAVLSIYRGELKKKSLTATCTVQAAEGGAAGQTTHSITMDFEDSSNPTENITSFSLLTDGLPRVHPKAFLALFEAARKARVKKLTVSSNWRPLLGSIAHRAGLGIDVSYLEDATHEVKMNREELRKNTPDLAWVSSKEKQLFKAYEKDKAAYKDAETAFTQANEEVSTADKSIKEAQAEKAKAGKDPAKRQAAEAKESAASTAKAAAAKALETATTKRKEAVDARNTARTAWLKEFDANEPACVRSFRDALKVDAAVKQLFDPWYMDGDTQDKFSAVPNEQCTVNGTLHAHHLHLTLHEPKIRAS